MSASADKKKKTCGQRQSRYTPNSTAARRNWRRRPHSSCRLDSQSSGNREEEEEVLKATGVITFGVPLPPLGPPPPPPPPPLLSVISVAIPFSPTKNISPDINSYLDYEDKKDLFLKYGFCCSNGWLSRCSDPFNSTYT